MINNLDLEFIQAFNPLYAVPIVAVIICAFIVYAVGFKTPVQPPSFDGIEEEKKIPKKRKTKENTKAKAVQNGKMNGSTTVKSQTSNKKKDPIEKIIPPEKSVTEKPTVAEKKAAKKAKAQNEKKSVGEKKKDMSHDEMNDDGWVKLLSKKGRKNRKKEDAIANEIQTSKIAKSVEITKSDESSQVEDSPKKIPEKVDKNPAVEQKQASSKAKKDVSKKEKDVALKVDKIQDQVLVENAKPDINDLQKLPTKENAVKEGKPREESNSKSKKKKKKNVEIVQEQNDTNEKISKTPQVQIIPEIPTSEIKKSANIVISSDHTKIISDNAEVDKSSEVKASNVAFDELAGLYPEVKKKKKVRRDH